MGQEKIEQNAQRLHAFIFHTLGCSKGDALNVINLFVKNLDYKRSESDKQIDKENMEKIISWANYIKTASREEWEPTFNAWMNMQYDVRDFHKWCEKTSEGRKILEKLNEENSKIRKNG